MIVYRLASSSELKSILDGKMDKIGQEYPVRNKLTREIVNTHRYKIGEKYLHFFKNKESINQLTRLKHLKNEQYYIVACDIPLPILCSSAGYGFYDPQGFDVDYKELREYAINVKKFKRQYLKNYFPIKIDEALKTQ